MTTTKSLHINAHGWLDNAIRLPSPYHNERPLPIDTLVIHNITLPPGVFTPQYVDALFLGTLPAHVDEHPYFAGIVHLTVSAHFYIARDGHIRQYVPIWRRAWHAGVSHYQGRDNCNDFSVGVELAGTDHHPYTLKQYQSLAALTRALFRACPQLSRERITTHQHIAPTRKTDPGPAFNRAYYLSLL